MWSLLLLTSCATILLLLERSFLFMLLNERTNDLLTCVTNQSPTCCCLNEVIFISIMQRRLSITPHVHVSYTRVFFYTVFLPSFHDIPVLVVCWMNVMNIYSVITKQTFTYIAGQFPSQNTIFKILIYQNIGK